MMRKNHTTNHVYGLFVKLNFSCKALVLRIKIKELKSYDITGNMKLSTTAHDKQKI